MDVDVKDKQIKKLISKDEIRSVAKLANINITQNEQLKYSKELSTIINYNMKHLNSINTDEIEATGHATGEKSVTRNDETEPGLSADAALKNAPKNHNNLFKVKHVFGDD